MVPITISCLLIVCAAGLLLFSLIKNIRVMETIVYVRHRQRASLDRYLRLHQGLMVFFVFGYLVVALTMATGHAWVSNSMISIVFLFGAVFVFIGIDVKVRLLSEVQSTLNGILPICSRCKKIRTDDARPEAAEAWKSIECYISEKASVSFSHGYCPCCYEKELAVVKGLLAEE